MFLPHQELYEMRGRLFPLYVPPDSAFGPASVDLSCRGPATVEPCGNLHHYVTEEVVSIPQGYLGFIWGRVGYAWDGIVAGIGSGLIPPGWYGQLTIPTLVFKDRIVKPGQRFVQIAVAELTTDTKFMYGDRR